VKNIAIIGAGMTGLSLAYNLQEHNITIFDKSWRPGGRVSTRKHDNYLFDHGAHYLSTNHSVNQLSEVISRYNLGQEIEIDFATDYLKNIKTRKKIIIGQNGINSIPKSIFDNIKLKSFFNSKIIKISKKNNILSLFSEKEEFKNFDYVLICIPYLQSKELSKDLIDFTQFINEPSYDPIHTVMLSYKDINNISIKAGLNLHKDISFFINQNIKFNKLSHDCWVLNMSSEYTNNNIDIHKTELEKYAQSIFEKTFGIRKEISFIKSHRWLYAQTRVSYNSISKKNWINSKDNKLFLSGDWVLGKSLSDAWDAGQKLSHYIKILSV
tara:strand:- start:93 stop:1067 length:975 start_codon:yes stop_codon:yes gene_type:complete